MTSIEQRILIRKALLTLRAVVDAALLAHAKSVGARAASANDIDAELLVVIFVGGHVVRIQTACADYFFVVQSTVLAAGAELVAGAHRVFNLFDGHWRGVDDSWTDHGLDLLFF